MRNETETRVETERNEPIGGPEMAATTREQELPGLGSVVGGLKAQLVELIRGNERLEQELQAARRAVVDGDQERKQLSARLEHLERESVSRDVLAGELDRIRGERDTLAGRVMDLEKSLAASEERVGEVGQVVDMLRLERDDMHQEAACLDAQFSRAIAVVNELRGALNNRQERETQLDGRIGALEAQLDAAMGERDSFELELAESRSALENVRQSLLSVSSEWRILAGR